MPVTVPVPSCRLSLALSKPLFPGSFVARCEIQRWRHCRGNRAVRSTAGHFLCTVSSVYLGPSRLSARRTRCAHRQYRNCACHWAPSKATRRCPKGKQARCPHGPCHRPPTRRVAPHDVCTVLDGKSGKIRIFVHELSEPQNNSPKE